MAIRSLYRCRSLLELKVRLANVDVPELGANPFDSSYAFPDFPTVLALVPFRNLEDRVSALSRCAAITNETTDDQ
jgi:hypothetical protein